MSFCVIADVEGLAPILGTLSATTKPTSTQATAYIAYVDAEIRGVLVASGFAETQTDTDALSQLKLYCAQGTLALILRGSRGKDSEASKEAQTVYEKYLEKIRSGEVIGLASGSTGALLPASRYTDSPSDVPDGRFSVDGDHW